MPKTVLICFLPLLLTSFLQGCESNQSKTKTADDVTETSLYRSARRSLQTHNYLVAIEQFQELEALFPFGRYAEQAQLEIIYAYYKAQKLDESRSAADRFIELHPQHANSDYAQYLKGLSAFARDRKSFELANTKSLLGRDLTSLEEAFNDFEELIEDFPHSEYAQDARQRMLFIRNTFAAKEVMIGKYYLDKKAYLAAVNRGRYVLDNYKQTPAVEDALALMADAYLFLGLEGLAKEPIDLLRINYPNHSGFENDTYVATPSRRSLVKPLLNIVTFGLLMRPAPPVPVVFKLDENTAQN